MLGALLQERHQSAETCPKKGNKADLEGLEHKSYEVQWECSVWRTEGSGCTLWLSTTAVKEVVVW